MPEQHKRILVVDDDPGLRELLASVLRMRGLVVDVASDGDEALALVRVHQYAVMLLDLLMPVRDGFSVIDGMARSELQSPPVVLVLSGADRDVLDRLDPQRIHGVVRKPFDAQELASLVLACSDIRARGPFGPMAIATMMTGAPLLALLKLQ